MMKPSALNLRVVVICHTAFSLHLLSSAEEPLHPSALSLAGGLFLCMLVCVLRCASVTVALHVLLNVLTDT